MVVRNIFLTCLTLNINNLAIEDMDAIFFFLRHILNIERSIDNLLFRFNNNNTSTTMATENGASYNSLALLGHL
ncbi:hypothetical protein D3C79_900370 [compost metagenome]